MFGAFGVSCCEVAREVKRKQGSWASALLVFPSIVISVPMSITCVPLLAQQITKKAKSCLITISSLIYCCKPSSQQAG